MPNINLDDAYILNETGAQVDKVTGLFTKDESTTEEEKAFAQLNIGTAGSNRNLLDNPWFTVRQRGDGPFTSGYTADRWVSTSGATVTLNASGTLTWATSSTYREFKQKIANPSYYANGTYTVSVNVVSATGVPWIILHNGNSGEILRKSLTVGMNSVTFTTGDSGIGMFGVYNIASANISVELKAVKLELGSVSTLANDAPPELSITRIPCYENHLRLKGQYAPVGYAIALSTTLALLAIPTPVPMRVAPTPSLNGTLYFNAGTPFAITSVQNPTLGVNQVMIQVVGTFDTGKVYLAQFRDANSYLDLSADL